MRGVIIVFDADILKIPSLFLGLWGKVSVTFQKQDE